MTSCLKQRRRTRLISMRARLACRYQAGNLFFEAHWNSFEKYSMVSALFTNIRNWEGESGPWRNLAIQRYVRIVSWEIFFWQGSITMQVVIYCWLMGKCHSHWQLLFDQRTKIQECLIWDKHTLRNTTKQYKIWIHQATKHEKRTTLKIKLSSPTPPEMPWHSADFSLGPAKLGGRTAVSTMVLPTQGHSPWWSFESSYILPRCMAPRCMLRNFSTSAYLSLSLSWAVVKFKQTWPQKTSGNTALTRHTEILSSNFVWKSQYFLADEILFFCILASISSVCFTRASNCCASPN